MNNATQKGNTMTSAGMSTLSNFTIVERRIENPHKFQFYVTWGMTHAGPWAKVGVDDTEYVVGFAPTPQPRRQQTRRPSQPTAETKNGQA